MHDHPHDGGGRMKGTTNSAPKGVMFVHESFTKTVTSVVSTGSWDINEFSDILERLNTIAKEGRMIKWNIIRHYTSGSGTPAESLWRTHFVRANNSISSSYLSGGTVYQTTIEQINNKWCVHTTSSTAYEVGDYVFNFWYMSDMTEA